MKVKEPPRAWHRDIADLLRELPIGDYTLHVEDLNKEIAFFGLPRLKLEGSRFIDFGSRVIYIIPKSQ